MLDGVESSAASKSVEASADRCGGELRNFELEVGEVSFSSPLGEHIIVLRISHALSTLSNVINPQDPFW